MSNKILFIIIGVAILIGVIATFAARTAPVASVPNATSTATSTPDEVVCAQDAMQCPDGTFVGRSGPNCEFKCPEPAPVDEPDANDQYPDTSDLIHVDAPAENAVITSPVKLTGEARGNWYFEASAPVTLVNWDGLIIAEGFVTAQGEWMTTEFVPFTGELSFTSPYKPGDPDFMKRGALIFKKDNPSGLPENDAAVEIPVRFAN